MSLPIESLRLYPLYTDILLDGRLDALLKPELMCDLQNRNIVASFK